MLETKPKVQLDSVYYSYFTAQGEVPALQDLSLEVHEGEFISIVGPSGCGKSTLLSLVAGLIKPIGGKVLLDGTVVDRPTPRIGYMFQHDYLFEWRDVLSNVLLGPEIQGKVGEESRQFALNLLERYGLADFQHHYPGQLSGGMRQRVALIRTLCMRPDVLLLDEPFSALDFQTRLKLSDEVHSILKREGKTVILITHDISEAVSMSDRVVVLSQRPARIKSEYEISFPSHGDERPTPFEARTTVEFNKYFDSIWEELDVHVNA